MMKKIMSKNQKIIYLFIIIVGVFFQQIISAQGLPTDYSVVKPLGKTVDANPSSNTVDRIFVQDKSTIWLGTSRGLNKTSDAGASWTNYYGSSAFGNESISAIGYGLGAIWAATWHPQSVSGSVIGVGSGLKYSSDYGNSWTAIDEPLDALADSVMTYGSNKIKANPAVVPQENFIYAMAFTKNTIWVVTKAGGLRRSTDMGKTWQKIVLPPDNLDSIKPTDQLSFSYNPNTNLNHRAFSVVSVGDDTLYVGTAGGINKTINASSKEPSWVKFTHTNQSKPISGNFIWSMSRNSLDGTLWAVTWKADGSTEYYGVSHSKDGGRSWTVTLTDERVRDFAFRFIPSTEIFAAAESGLYRSENGKTWLAAPKIKDSQTGVEIKPTMFLSVDTNTLNSGTLEVWTGTDDGVAKSIETVTDPWWAKWKVYFAAGKTITTSESFAFPNPYNPKYGVVRIKYNLSNAANVTLRIMDFGMNLVKTVLQNAPRVSNSEQVDYWDGKDENGKTVPNGVYFYRLDADSSNPLFGKIIVVM